MAAEMEQCDPGTHKFVMAYGGERASSAPDFFMPSPGATFHREVLGYDDAAVSKLWLDAGNFFFDQFGVDLRSFEVQDGFKEISGKWRMEYYEVLLDMHVFYASNKQGLYNCPAVYRGAIIGLISLDGANKFYGKFGGNEGVAANQGDIVDFGHSVAEFGPAERLVFHFRSRTPMRNSVFNNGVTNINCEVFNDQFGTGSIRATFTVTPINSGFLLGSISSIMSF